MWSPGKKVEIVIHKDCFAVPAAGLTKRQIAILGLPDLTCLLPIPTLNIQGGKCKIELESLISK